jgi:hypothetical protein
MALNGGRGCEADHGQESQAGATERRVKFTCKSGERPEPFSTLRWEMLRRREETLYHHFAVLAITVV